MKQKRSAKIRRNNYAVKLVYDKDRSSATWKHYKYDNGENIKTIEKYV